MSFLKKIFKKDAVEIEPIVPLTFVEQFTGYFNELTVGYRIVNIVFPDRVVNIYTKAGYIVFVDDPIKKIDFNSLLYLKTLNNEFNIDIPSNLTEFEKYLFLLNNVNDSDLLHEFYWNYTASLLINICKEYDDFISNETLDSIEMNYNDIDDLELQQIIDQFEYFSLEVIKLNSLVKTTLTKESELYRTLGLEHHDSMDIEIQLVKSVDLSSNVTHNYVIMNTVQMNTLETLKDLSNGLMWNEVLESIIDLKDSGIIRIETPSSKIVLPDIEKPVKESIPATMNESFIENEMKKQDKLIHRNVDFNFLHIYDEEQNKTPLHRLIGNAPVSGERRDQAVRIFKENNLLEIQLIQIEERISELTLQYNNQIEEFEEYKINHFLDVETDSVKAENLANFDEITEANNIRDVSIEMFNEINSLEKQRLQINSQRLPLITELYSIFDNLHDEHSIEVKNRLAIRKQEITGEETIIESNVKSIIEPQLTEIENIVSDSPIYESLAKEFQIKL